MEYRRQRGLELERMYLQLHDSHGFRRTWRGPRPSLPDWVLRQPDLVLSTIRPRSPRHLPPNAPQCPPHSPPLQRPRTPPAGQSMPR